MRDEIDAKIFETSGKISVIEDQLTCEKKNREEIALQVIELEGEIRRTRLKMTQKEIVFEKEIETRKRKLEEMRRVREKLQEKKKSVENELQITLKRTEAVLQEKLEREAGLIQSSDHNKTLKSKLSFLQEEACRLTHCPSPLKEIQIPVNTDRETESSIGDSFLLDKENYEMKGICEEDAGKEELERELQYLQAENKLLRGTKPIQLGREPRPISETQAMAVRDRQEHSCCTVF
jgi:hypothetical protein